MQLLLMTWCIHAAAGFSQAEKPQDPAKPEPPKSVSSLLETKTFPETKMYFETVMGDHPVGYQVSSLTPVKPEGGEGTGAAYEYRAESILTRDNGMRIDSVTIARLKRNFEPISITIDRQLSHPESKARHIEDRVQVGESEITIAHEDSMAPGTPPRSLPKPNEPFVYGMEFIIEALDVSHGFELPIPELDSKEGMVFVYRVVSGRKENGKHEMVLQKADGGIGYRFSVGQGGRIETWADSDSPAMMKRVAEEQYKEARKGIEGK